MEAKFVIGRAGSGKTEYCLNEIAESINWGKPLLLLVPNQFSLEMEKNLVRKTKGKGMDRAEVLSFERLAYRVFSLYGKPEGKILDDTGKAALIKKLLYDNKENLKYYGGSYKKEGFVNMLGSIFTEFYKYGINQDKLSLVYEKDESLTAIKLKDISLIFSEFNSYIKDKYISQEQNLDLLSDALADAAYYHGCKIWIDGFFRFTAQDYKVIKRLTEIAYSVTISLTMPETTDLNKHTHPYDPFYETKTAARNIIELLNQDKLEKTVRLSKKESYGYSKALMHLEKEYFDYSPVPYNNTNENVFITAFGSVYDEIKYLAANIASLVRDFGYRYKDIAVCLCDLSAYEHTVKEAFSICRIPCFIDGNRAVYRKPLVEMIRALIDIGVTDFSEDSVIRLLRTGLLPFELREIDILENYILEYGIKGYKWKFERWNWGEGRNVYHLEGINRMRTRIVDILSPFFHIWSGENCPTVKEASEEVYRFIDKNKIPDRLLLLEEHKEAAQIWNLITLMFEKIVEIMGDEPADIHSFAQTIESALENVKEGVIPAAQDVVIVGDIKRTQLPETKVLFVAGLNDGVFPSVKGSQGLLSETDREIIAKKDVELAPYGIRETINEQFLAYRVMTKPKDRLYLSYPAMNFDDEQVSQSIVVEKIMEIFPNAKASKPEFLYASEKALLTEAAAQISQLKYNGKNNKEDSCGVLKWLKNSNAGAYEVILDSAYVSKYNEKAPLDKYKNKDINSSVTKIETYINCPFSYFAKYELEAKERKLYGLLPVDLGSIYHNALDILSCKIEENGLKWGNLHNEVSQELIDQSVMEACSGYDISAEKFTISRIKAITKRTIWAIDSHINRGSFVPKDFEVGFGGGKPLESVTIELNEGYRLVFSGRIDRVDIYDNKGNKYVKIIDYKSGDKSFDLYEVYYGLQLQLMLYMDAYLKKGEEYLPGGVLYFKIKDPIINYPTNDDSEDAIAEEILNAMKTSGLVVDDLDIINAMHNGLTGSSNIIPVKLKGGKKGAPPEIGAYSSTASIRQFYALMERVTQVIKEAGNRLIMGDIEPKPVRYGKKSPCRYCLYGTMCGFDTTNSYKYRYLEKLNKKEIIKNLEK